MTTLIGLHGRRGAGKDTAFGFIQEWASERGLRASRRGFADALKFSFARIFLPDCSLEEGVQWCDELKIEEGFKKTAQLSIVWQREDAHRTTTGIQHSITGRQALQRYGTEAHRDVFGTNFWVDALLPVEVAPDGTPFWPMNFVHMMQGIQDSTAPDFAVVTDVRFENEAERIRELGGEIWEINRASQTHSDPHSSEVPLPINLIDVTVINKEEGNLAGFREEVFSMMGSRT